jgi:hypothetical protein
MIKHVVSVAGAVLLALAGLAQAQSGGAFDLQSEIDEAHVEFVSTEGLERVTVEVPAGFYEPSTGLVVKEGVDLVALEGPENTTISPLEVNTFFNAAVAVEPNASIQGFRIVLPADLIGVKANDPEELRVLYIQNADKEPVEVLECVLTTDAYFFEAKQVETITTIGVFLYQGGRDTLIRSCDFLGLEYGIWAIDSGANITRNLFNVISDDAVFVESFQADRGKQNGEDVPLLGDLDNADDTGLNVFREVEDLFVNNTTGQEMQAENNDWGVYGAGEIAAKTSGQVDTMFFLGSSIGPGTVIAAVLDAAGEPVPASANPTCTISPLGLAGQRDSASGSFVFTGVSDGTYTVQAAAEGYTQSQSSVEVKGASPSGVTLSLAESTNGDPGQPNACGQPGKAVYALTFLIVFEANRRYRKRRVGQNQ